MSLIPTKYTQHRIGDYAKPYPYTQSQDAMIVECGFYVDPATGKEILIEKIVQSVSWYGRIMHRDEEHWTYDVPGAPPVAYLRETYARSYLPWVNPGRGYKLMEREEATFIPWTWFQPGYPNLSSTRTFSGYCIYDMKPDREELSAEAKQALQDRDQDDGEGSGGATESGDVRLVIDSVRTWREAADEAGVIEKTGTPQIAKWVEPFKVETETVFEELDKFLVYKTTDVRIRPGAMKHEGPLVRRRENFRYRLPVEIMRPEIAANVVENEIRIEVTGGGATVNGVDISPTSYRIMRRITAAGDRGASPDPYDRYLSDPAVPERRRIILTTNVEGLDGAPRSPLPVQTPYTEPGDATEPEFEGWVVIANPDNEHAAGEEGFASFVDEDLENGATYEYTATAVINRDESAPADPVTVSYNRGNRESKIKVRVNRDPDGPLEVDVIAPDDPVFPDYGETIELESPVVVYPETAEDFGEEVGRRLFGKTRDPRLKLSVVANVPLTILERGQLVTLPAVQWKTTGNELVIESETNTDEWLLDGFRLRVRRSSSGRLEEFGRTELDLVEP